MSDKNNQWYKRIEIAVARQENLTVTFNNFESKDWNNFIKKLVRGSLPFSIPDFTFDNPIVCFLPVLASLNEKSHSLIRQAIEAILQRLYDKSISGILDSNTKKDAKNAFLIAYAVPICIKEIDLLKNIALKHSIGVELRSYAARLIANHRDTTEMYWWKKLIEIDDETTFSPIAVDLFAQQSSEIAIKLLKELKQPSSVDNFKIVIGRLLELIVSREECQDFSLDSFPNWCHDYIKKLFELKEFKQLKYQWMISEEEKITRYKAKLTKYLGTEIEVKDKLPTKDYPVIIKNDETLNSVSKLLLEDDINRVLIVGQSEAGTGLTSRALSIAHYFSKTNKNIFIPIFIGSNVKNVDDICLVIRDNLENGLIKNCSEYNSKENVVNFIKDLSTLNKFNEKKLLLIIDDFHKKDPDKKNAIGRFLVDIQDSCKVVIAIRKIKKGNLSNSVIQDVNLNKNFMLNARKIPVEPNLTFQTFDKKIVHEATQKLDREEFLVSLAKCYHNNPLAMNLALAGGLQLVNCPLPEEDLVFHAFKELAKSLDSLSMELLISISIFHDSKIFHDLSLSQKAFGYILPNESEKSINDAITKLISLDLLAVSNVLTDFPRVAIYDAICNSTLKLKGISGKETDELRNNIFSRLTEYYIKFTDDYGGSDWDNRNNFEKIETEWYNVLAILEWNKNNNHFPKVRELWFAVNRFADLYGHWGSRRKWLEILIGYYYKEHYSKGSEDLNIYARCLASKGWTLTMCGNCFYQDAEEVLLEAWKLKGVELVIRSYIAHNLTVLYYRRGEEYLDQAKDMIEEQEKLYAKIDENRFKDHDKNFTERDLQRLLINYIRDKAKIQLMESNYDKAYNQYSNCLEMSDEINWIRMKSYFHYMLADTLLEQIKSTSNFSKLNDILNHIVKGVEIAKNNKNKRRLALFKKLYANLLNEQGDPRAEKLYQEAEHDIQSLGLNY